MPEVLVQLIGTSVGPDTVLPPRDVISPPPPFQRGVETLIKLNQHKRHRPTPHGSSVLGMSQPLMTVYMDHPFPCGSVVRIIPFSEEV